MTEQLKRDREAEERSTRDAEANKLIIRAYELSAPMGPKAFLDVVLLAIIPGSLSNSEARDFYLLKAAQYQQQIALTEGKK